MILVDAQVTAAKTAKGSKWSKWATNIWLNGTYNGPTDIVANREYQIRWRVEGKKLYESGVATLESSSGEFVRQVWSSIITPGGPNGKAPPALRRFPSDGELIEAAISPFKIDGNKMSYEWTGTVRKGSIR